jgi:ribosomal RNA-processing protein 8
MAKRKHSGISSEDQPPSKASNKGNKGNDRKARKGGENDKSSLSPKKNKVNEEKKEDASTWSKSKKKRIRQLKSKMMKGGTTTETLLPDAPKNMRKKDLTRLASSTSATDVSEVLPREMKTTGLSSPSVETFNDTSSKKKSTKLQDSFKARLSGSRFRILNEELYTTTSSTSFDRFSNNPELYHQYHEGFRHQVEQWPINPVNVIVHWLSSNYAHRDNTKKGDSSSNVIVADFGCGDAQLAQDLLKVIDGPSKKCPFTVHSFDLVSSSPLVTACDMANIPLEDKSVDVCIFCLSLMGTNLADFVREAHRVLKDNGRVKIAEVRSRLEYSHAPSTKDNDDHVARGKRGKKNDQKENKKGGDGSNNNEQERLAGTLEEFLQVLEELGFACVKTDRSNKMFVLLELKKNTNKPNQKLEFTAKPCIYKRR